MAFEVAVWNSRDNWGKPDEYKKALEQFKRLDADVVVLPEAYGEEHDSEALIRSRAALESEGYAYFERQYNDTDGRKDRHFLMMCSRLGGNFAGLDLGSRQAIKLQIEDEDSQQPVSIYGLHLDDRHERTRLDQSRAVVASHLKQNAANIWQEKALVVMGDLNAMHRDAPDAGLLRSSRYVTRWLPSVDPGQKAPNLAKLGRIASLGQRLGEMAMGDTLQSLMGPLGLEEADKGLKPTKGPFQLDHILYTKGYLSVDNFTVQDKASSDHRAISARLSFKEGAY